MTSLRLQLHCFFLNLGLSIDFSTVMETSCKTYRRLHKTFDKILAVNTKIRTPPEVLQEHWRRQLWGTGARAPLLDFQLDEILRTNTENVQKQRDFCAIFINFWPIFVTFCPQFSSGSNYSSQNAGTIANKFQLHTYFRFR